MLSTLAFFPKQSEAVDRTTARHIIVVAKRYIGVPYVWGGNTPKGFDCSGFVKYCYAKQGLWLPRTTRQQMKVGKKVSKSRLKLGDEVFFKMRTKRDGIHSGIYIGKGKFIHASTSKGVIISSLYNPYWKKCYLTARRYY